MPADRPRAWQYMGANPNGTGRFIHGRLHRTWATMWVPYERGDHYVDVHPLTPDDIPLAPPVEVTAEDVRRALGESGALAVAADRGLSPFDVADRINERLAARREGQPRPTYVRVGEVFHEDNEGLPMIIEGPDDVYRNLPDGTAIYIRQEGE